jgi:hypothetical protein
MHRVQCRELYPDEPDERRPHSRVLDVSLPLDNSKHPCVAHQKIIVSRSLAGVKEEAALKLAVLRSDASDDAIDREITEDRSTPATRARLSRCSNSSSDFMKTPLTLLRTASAVSKYSINHSTELCRVTRHSIAVSSPARRFIKHS